MADQSIAENSQKINKNENKNHNYIFLKFLFYIGMLSVSTCQNIYFIGLYLVLFKV